MKLEVSGEQAQMICDALDARIATVSRTWAKETNPEIRKIRAADIGRLRDLKVFVGACIPVS